MTLHPDLRAVSEAAVILSPTRYVILGETREISLIPENSPEETPALVKSLEQDLYTRLYTRAVESGPVLADQLAWRDHVAALSAANTGRGTWEPGWVIGDPDTEGRIAVSKDGMTLFALPEGVRVAADQCRVRVPREWRHLVPGFYFAIGDTESTDKPEPSVRFYWHLTARAAVPYMATTTKALNGGGIPFRTKVLSDPGAYQRADAGVLYVARRDCDRLGNLLPTIYRRIASELRAQTPLFTRSLAPGLAVADDPGDGMSFGQHRCRLAALSLWRSFLQGDTSVEARVATLAATFREAGIDPNAPHRSDCRENDKGYNHVFLTPSFSCAPVPAALSVQEVAVRIGQQLCRTAYWDEQDRFCNWMSRSSRESPRRGQPVTPTTAALGPDLYGGNAGIALFLAQLASVTGDDICRQTALGAIACSFRQLLHLPATKVPTLSFHSGAVGVAYAGHRIARLTGEKWLDNEVDAILNNLESALSQPHSLDLMSGNAGAIPALLVLGRRALAMPLGDELCRTAIRKGNIWMWDAERVCGPGVSRVLLTGFAHGAAGIGLSLLELHAATGNNEYLEGGRAAFAYEDQLFDSRERNWPDLRDYGPRFATAWCHGAPGIALARLRASILDPDQRERHIAIARIAFATTLAALDAAQRQPQADASLCHGLAGLSEIVLTAGEWLADEDLGTGARKTATELIARHAEREDWPSGLVSRAANPSLMLGTAGIGYHFLRLSDPKSRPPVLLCV
jgi:hypothetical protein